MEREGETVVLSADEYDELLYRLDLLEGIAHGLADIARGDTIPHEQVMKELLAEFPAEE